MTQLVLSVLLGLVARPDVLDLHAGMGEPLREGDRYTITYKVEIVHGKQLANSDLRGLPYSKELGDGHDGYFDQWIRGMRLGGKRQVLISANEVQQQLKFSLPPKQDVIVTLKLVGVKRKPDR